MRVMTARAAAAITLAACVLGFTAEGASASVAHHGPGPNLGSNVIVLSPSMSQATIQSTLNTIATQQVPNQFGTQRYAILFEPGTYGSAADPLIFQVGYYTEVAGLGAQPGDVVINGAIDVFNQCPSGGGPCDGTDNFWRSLSNLTLNVTLPEHTADLRRRPPARMPAATTRTEMWAVSQASPMRRVIMNGIGDAKHPDSVILQDYCNEGFVSGGFFADDEFNGGTVEQRRPAAVLHPQQRHRQLDQRRLEPGIPRRQRRAGDGLRRRRTQPVHDAGEPPRCPRRSRSSTRIRAVTTTCSCPAVQRDSVGPSYASRREAGTSIPIRRFFIADPSTPLFADQRGARARTEPDPDARHL